MKHECCDQCHHPYSIIQNKLVNKHIEVIPARYIEVHTYMEVGKCNHCPDSVPVTPERPLSLIPRSKLTPSLASQIIYDKFTLGVPLDRQRQNLQRVGLIISETTLCSWVINLAQQLEVLFELMLTELKRSKYLHADESPYLVLKKLVKEKDRFGEVRERRVKNPHQSYLWVLQTVKSDPRQIVIFHCAPSRGHAVIQELLKGWSGTLTTDGYSGYHQLEGITGTGCWAHAHRRFRTAAAVGQSAQLAAKFDDLIDQLYRIESEIADLSPAERLRIRQDQSRKILAEFWELTGKYPVINKSKLQGAISYALNHRQELEAFLSDPAIEIDNNRVERSIRSFVICRNNFLFSTSPKGAKANSIFLSLAVTAKLNQLDFQKYLEYLFSELPQFYGNPTTKQMAAYLPWTKEVQEHCSLLFS